MSKIVATVMHDWRRFAIECAIMLAVFSGGLIYYESVWAPVHQAEVRRQARVKWMEIAASMGYRKDSQRPEDNWRHYGSIENVRVLSRCFRIGDLASECADILATGVKEERSDVTIYSWVFDAPMSPEVPVATIYVYSVSVKGDPGIITSEWFVWSGY